MSMYYYELGLTVTPSIANVMENRNLKQFYHRNFVFTNIVTNEASDFQCIE